MDKRRTQLLIVLVVAALAASGVGYARLDKQRDDAIAAARDVAACRRDLADLAAAKASPGGMAPISGEQADLHRRVRDAAVAAGIAESQLVSVDSVPARPVADSDYQEFPVILRLDPVTMKQVTVFLHEMARRDPGSRTKSIELTPPSQPGAGPAEQWTADITLAYLIAPPAGGNRGEPARNPAHP